MTTHAGKNWKWEGSIKQVGQKINTAKSIINATQHVKGGELEDVKGFICLSAATSKQGGGMKDIKASVEVGQLKKVGNVTKISRSTKIRLYKNLVILILFHSAKLGK